MKPPEIRAAVRGMPNGPLFVIDHWPVVEVCFVLTTCRDFHTCQCFQLPAVPVVLSIDNEDSPLNSVELQKLLMWQNLAVHLTPVIQKVVEFAKRIPG